MDVVSTEEKFQSGLGRQWGDFILVSPEARRCVHPSVWVREAVVRLSLGGFTGLVTLEFIREKQEDPSSTGDSIR